MDVPKFTIPSPLTFHGLSPTPGGKYKDIWENGAEEVHAGSDRNYLEWGEPE